MIYVASPYSHPDPAVRARRALLVARYAAALMNHGTLAYSPIAHGHAIYTGAAGTRFEVSGYAFDAWRAHSLRMLRMCDSLDVLMLDGWDESEGVGAEIKAAEAIGIPVRYRQANGLESL